MTSLLSNIQIKNFKTIQDISIDNFGRINLFIGKPNVGKSNLLEALSLLGSAYIVDGSPFASHIIRYEEIPDLFFDQSYTENPIEIISAGLMKVFVSYDNGVFTYRTNIAGKGEGFVNFRKDGQITHSGIAQGLYFNKIKKYQFPEKQKFITGSQFEYLMPPFGENLLEILKTNKILRTEAASLFEAYGLELLVDSQSARIDVAKRRDGILFKTPYSLVADTLRRYLFHLVAIESNRDSVLLLEEPESHNFPPYIRMLAQRIAENQSNQYFITTHSPFLFNTLVENARDVAVFVVDYDHQGTHVRKLTEENLREVLDYGLNLFTEVDFFAE